MSSLAAVLLATGRPPGEALRGLITFPFVTAIMVFGWVTLVFALIDAKVGPAALADVQSGHKALFDKWDPRTLPPVPVSGDGAAWQVVLDLVGAVLVLAWWLAVPSTRSCCLVRRGFPCTGSRPACRLRDCRDLSR